MKNTSKTFKIGECCVGGIIQVGITATQIKVTNKQWDNSAGYRRSSNQSNAEILSEKMVPVMSGNSHRELFFYLTDLTTAYYADSIIKWIETKIALN